MEGTKFLTFVAESGIEDMDVLIVNPDVKNIEEIIGNRDYSDIYVLHTSDELIRNLKSEFGERMDSLEIEGIRPMWKIKL